MQKYVLRNQWSQTSISRVYLNGNIKLIYSIISISQTTKGNENRFKKSGVREIEGKITDNLNQGKQPLVREIGRFEKLGFEKSVFHCIPLLNSLK